MKIGDMIKELTHLQSEHGDIQVVFQLSGEQSGDGNIGSFESFFIVAEEYPDSGWMVNLRTWPY